MKKFFSLVLALVMALSLTTVAWGADALALKDANGVIQLAENTAYDQITDLTGVTKIVGATGATVAGINFIGAVSGLTLENVTFTKDVYFAGGNVTNLTVNKCKFSNASLQLHMHRQDMPVYTAENLVVTNCEFDGVSSELIPFEAATHKKTSIWGQNLNGATFTGNTITGSAHNAIQFDVSVEGAIEISNNTISNTGDRALRFGPVKSGATLAIQDNNVTNGVDDNGEVMKATSLAADVTVKAWNNDWDGGTVVNAELADIGSGVTTDANGLITGGTFTTTPPAAFVAPGYSFVNGSVVNNAGQFNTLTGGVGVDAATGTWGATLDAALADTTYSAVMQPYAPAVPSIKSFPTCGLVVTHKTNLTVNTYGPFVKVPSALNADYVFVSGSNIVYLDAVPSTNKYDADATAVKVGFNSALYAKCEAVYVDDADEAGTYYLYEDEYYEEVTPAQKEKVFNVNGVVVYAAKTDKVHVQPHAYKYDTVKTNANLVTGLAVTKVYCSTCNTNFDFVDGTKEDAVKKFGAGNYEAAIAGVKGTIYVRTGSIQPILPSVPSTDSDKVTSAETFDAGIAMYVGMSVMAAAGSVVVLKKRED